MTKDVNFFGITINDASILIGLIPNSLKTKET